MVRHDIQHITGQTERVLANQAANRFQAAVRNRSSTLFMEASLQSLQGADLDANLESERLHRTEAGLENTSKMVWIAT